MGLRHLLLIAFAFNLVARIEAASTDQALSPVKRMLREETQFTENTESLIEAEEERAMAWEALKMLNKGSRMHKKMDIYLRKNRPPGQFLDKYNIMSADDEMYKFFSSYFMKFYSKNPSKRPSMLPPLETHDIVMTRIKFWLSNFEAPEKVAVKLKSLGGKKSPYYELYTKMLAALEKQLAAKPPPLDIVNPNYAHLTWKVK